MYYLLPITYYLKIHSLYYLLPITYYLKIHSLYYLLPITYYFESAIVCITYYLLLENT